MKNNKKNRQPMTESLEARVMFASHVVAAVAPVALSISTAAYQNGTELVINGTSKNDNITVTKTDAGLVIGNTGGWSTTVAGNFKAIAINGLAGNDKITVDASVTTNTIIHGNAGNDTLSGGSGNDQIYADAGNDVLFGNAGDDTFVTIGGGKDKMTGGTGTDSFWMASKSQTVTDLTGDEAGNVHKVASFASVTTKVVSGRKIKTVTTKIASTLNGQNLLDPAASTGMVYQNFSSHTLFADNGPIADDVQQGYLGDCYFLATLSSVAKTDANLIKQSVVDLGDGTYAVQFSKAGKQVFVRVDADLPVWADDRQLAYANAGHQGSIWTAIMEKAYAVFRTGANTYASIEAGWMSEVYSALGKASTSVFSVTTGQSLLAIIQTALNQGKSVTMGVSTPTDGAPLIGNHAYSVDHVNVDSNGNAVSVTLRNPWGIDGAGNDGHNDGYVTITAAQAKNAFLGLMIATV